MHKTPLNPFLRSAYYIFVLLLEDSGMEFVLRIRSDGCYRYNKGQGGLTGSRVAKIIKKTGDGVY